MNIVKNSLRFTRIDWEYCTNYGICYESVKNTPNACKKPVQIKKEFVTIFDNLWDFLSR